jgi:SAM-dependent methyltransferase
MNARELKELLPRPVRRRLGRTRRWVYARPARTRKQQEALLASPALTPAENELVGRVASRISYKDEMYTGDGEHYFKVGLSAIDCIEEALRAAQLANVQSILDLPCGYGRVLRFLVQRFPSARIRACELMPDAVRFCAEQFDAVPLLSSYDLNKLTLDTQFDLIWCGSLITHLEDWRALDLLRFFARHLNVGGLVVFTTHGDYVAERLFDQADFYALPRAVIPDVVASYQQDGFGYVDYPGVAGYGVSVSAPAWIRTQARAAGNLQEVYFRARGWDEHQDVFGFVKTD